MKNKFEKMKQTDIRTVDTNTLIDIQSISIRENISTEEKVKEYIKQIKNPYCFKCGDIVVKISFSEDDVTLEDKIEDKIEDIILSL